MSGFPSHVLTEPTARHNLGVRHRATRAWTCGSELDRGWGVDISQGLQDHIQLAATIDMRIRDNSLD